ncbi:hypothetical protein C5167_021948 [Papaver somniferum]|uniref:Aminotransferase-like plant mobile domain-containing protein n=1 Tax=Papaver somniferum TaxID=3469 RepID=A0A4Y7JJL0_PAPSO|nr:hypothetical protein C5167_021948 [Papaver somniferum]
MDHKDAIRVIKRQKASKWDPSKECAEFQAKVKECVLYKAIELAHADFDPVAVSAFLERHYPDTYTMYLPFGEMAITPDDFHNITDLPLEDKCLREGYNPSMSYESLEALAQKCLGWDARKSQCEFRRSVRSPKKGDEYNAYEANETKKNTVKKFKLVKLKAAFSETKKKVTKGKLVMDAETLRHHVTAYWLYMLGTVIFPDTSGNRVDAHYLQLLEDLDGMNNYSWATGVLAFVLEEMSKGSRIRCNQIGGYLTLVQKPYTYDQPTTGKWLFLDAQKKSKEEQFISLRERFDELTVNDVVFHPYGPPDDVFVDEKEVNAFSQVAPYYGPIWHPNGYAIYNPRRILRQLCCVQMDPDMEQENFTLQVEGTKNSGKYFEPKHEPTPAVAHWNALTTYHVKQAVFVPCEGDVTACDEDYMEFYEEISHRFVINKEQQAISDAAKAKDMEAKKSQKEVPICGEEAKRL